MTIIKSREIRLASRPKGFPLEENFTLVEVEVPEPKEGEVLIRNLYMSVDPYMRGRMNDQKSYIPPFEIGKALEGGAIGTVVASKNANFKIGDKVSHVLGWREVFLSSGQGLQKIDAQLAPLSSYLGLLGMTGMTAWIGLHEMTKLKSKDIVFISAAAGAVGMVAGQLAKLRGCTVIGSTGSDEKVEALKREFHFDSAFNYKKGDVLEQLTKAAPNGIDVYFDNVGGDHLQAALSALRPFGRIAACGAISQYHNETPAPGPNNLFLIIGKRLTMRGFIVSDHMQRWPEMAREVGQYLREGKIINRELVIAGIENAPSAFLSMLQGKNIGKTLVKLADDL